MRAKARLLDLWVPRVDLVSAPANRKRFLVLKEVGQMPDATNTAVVECSLTAEEKQKVKEVLTALWPLYEEGKVPGSIIAQLGALVGYPAPEGYPTPYAYPAAKQDDPLAQVKDMISNLAAKDEVKAEVTKAIESIEKSWAEKEKTLVEALQKAEARLKELEAALKAEQEAKERMAILNELKEKYPNVATFAPELIEKAANMRNTELFESLTKMLATIDGILKQAPLLKEIGERGQDTDPRAELEREARTLLEKGEAPSLEKARIRVLEKRPDLYKALRGGV